MKRVFLFGFFIFIIAFVVSAPDVLVLQGQYYENGKLQKGVFNFTFNIYDSREGGELLYSNSYLISTGDFGEWYIEIENITDNIKRSNGGYYLEVLVDSKKQGKRKRLVQFEYMMKSVVKIVNGEVVFNSELNVKNNSYFEKLYVDGEKVCLESGKDCPKFEVNLEDVDKIKEIVRYEDFILRESGLVRDRDFGICFSDGKNCQEQKVNVSVSDDPVFWEENKRIWNFANEIVSKLSGYVLKGDIANYYTKKEIDKLITDFRVKPDFSGVGGVGYLYKTGGGRIVKNWMAVTFDKIYVLDSDYKFSEGGSGVEFNNDGLFEVNFECGADVVGNSRYHVDWRGVVNGDEIEGSRGASYHRLRADGRSSVSVTFLRNFKKGDVLEFQGKSDSSKSVVFYPSSCRLIIKNLKEKQKGFGSVAVVNSENNWKIGEVRYLEKRGFEYYNGKEWVEIKGERDKKDDKDKIKNVEDEDGIEEIDEAMVLSEEGVVVVDGENSANNSIESGDKNESVTPDNDVANDSTLSKDVSESGVETNKDESVKEVEDNLESSGNEGGVSEAAADQVREVIGLEDIHSEKDKKEVSSDSDKKDEVDGDVVSGDWEGDAKPEQLFDIRMDLEDVTIEKSVDLTAVVTYESFGSVPTPVNLTFEVYDLAGNLLYIRDGFIVVRVEEIRRYDFNDLNLEPGEYEFVFKTLYNKDVSDEFRQKFIIKDNRGALVKFREWVYGLFR